MAIDQLAAKPNYFYQTQAGDYHATRKMVVLKQVGFSYYLLEGLNGG